VSRDPSILNEKVDITGQNCVLSIIHDASNTSDPQNAFLLLEKKGGPNIGDRTFQYFELQISEERNFTKKDEELSIGQFREKMKGKDCYHLSAPITLVDANGLWGRLRQEEVNERFLSGKHPGYFDLPTSLVWASMHFNARSPSLWLNSWEDISDDEKRAANFKKIRCVVHRGDFSDRNNNFGTRWILGGIGIGGLAASIVSYVVKPEETTRFFTNFTGNTQLPEEKTSATLNVV
jgi:hypothetical protein